MIVIWAIFNLIVGILAIANMPEEPIMIIMGVLCILISVFLIWVSIKIKQDEENRETLLERMLKLVGSFQD